jgi:hypothetical protein
VNYSHWRAYEKFKNKGLALKGEIIRKEEKDSLS